MENEKLQIILSAVRLVGYLSDLTVSVTSQWCKEYNSEFARNFTRLMINSVKLIVKVNANPNLEIQAENSPES